MGRGVYSVIYCNHTLYRVLAKWLGKNRVMVTAQEALPTVWRGSKKNQEEGAGVD